MAKLFVIDEDKDTQWILKYFLEKKGIEVVTFDKEKDLLAVIEKDKPDLILMNANFNDDAESHLCEDVKQKVGQQVEVLVFSSDYNALVNYHNPCINALLHKPFDLHGITQAVNDRLNSKGQQ